MVLFGGVGQAVQVWYGYKKQTPLHSHELMGFSTIFLYDKNLVCGNIQFRAALPLPAQPFQVTRYNKSVNIKSILAVEYIH